MISVTFILFFFTFQSAFAFKIAVVGATGYIGRQVVKELVDRGIFTTSLVRSYEMPDITKRCLDGSNMQLCDILNPDAVNDALSDEEITAVIVCLASRSGIPRDAWLVDFEGGKNVINALENNAKITKTNKHYVLLSAFCVGKPLLQFQFAKLKLEDILQSSPHISHSIVRPTAFFKSLDGQIESVQKGNPILYFGDGTCSANAISETDLAAYLADCAMDPKKVNMYNQCRNIGGPDVPPITKYQQAELIYNTLNIPHNKRKYVSIPLGVLDVLISGFALLELGFRSAGLKGQQMKMEDAAEIVRIIRYVYYVVYCIVYIFCVYTYSEYVYIYVYIWCIF